MRSHLLHLLIYSTIVSVFLAVLLRSTKQDRIRLGAALWATMVVGALVLAWVMYPFPS